MSSWDAMNWNDRILIKYLSRDLIKNIPGDAQYNPNRHTNEECGYELIDYIETLERLRTESVGYNGHGRRWKGITSEVIWPPYTYDLNGSTTEGYWVLHVS